ncbi:ATP-binding protein [Pseudomonas koreensis]|uniref:ATP-binding protein n=1 Tax=Pseudomonas koreensis TaxID=198620 RepID=UPI0021C79B9C|nr:ATP-binding protein [Pseudomonas koreensis]MCU0092564.1 ATP-binding protein [Pseudomonas koreensis]
MLSEGALRAQRVCRELVKYSVASGVDQEELEEIAYMLLAGSALKNDFRIYTYLPASQASRFEALLSDILTDGNPETAEHLFHEFRSLLADAVNCKWKGVERSSAVSALAVRFLSGMLMHELGESDSSVSRYVLDVLFYKLYSRHIPAVSKHHQLVAAYALPLARMIGGVAELQPGPAEIFTFSGMPEGRDLHHNQFPDEMPQLLVARLRLLRNLRLAAYNIVFEGIGVSQRTLNLCLVDKTLKLPRKAYGDSSLWLFEPSKIRQTLEIRRASHPPMLVVLKSRDRRQGKKYLNLRRELVEHHDLRAVIDFTSFTATGTSDFCLLYFGRPFPDYPDKIAQIDARHLRPDIKTDEVLTCGALVGGLLKIWSEGRPISKEVLEESGAPRRIIDFIEESLPQSYPEIPGFVRFVTTRQMRERDYSLRTDDFVERKEERSWRPDVEIGPILNSLQAENQNRSIYLIGDNGSGKSLALRDIAIALAQEESQSFGISFGATDRFDRAPKLEPLKSFFTYAGARTLQSGPNTRRALGELGNMVRKIFDDTDRLDCFEAALGRLGFQPKQYLVPIDMSSTSDPGKKLLSNIYPLSAREGTERERHQLEQRRKLAKGAYKIGVMRHESSEIVTFDALSSGEQQILTMVIKIVANVQPNTTVLLDEPEISLHVGWQRQLPQVLREFSRVLGCSFVVATHSPILIASTNDANDHCFVMSKRRLHELTPTQRRSVEASLFEGFQTYTPYTHHVQERCAAIISGIIGESDEQGLVSNVEEEFLNELVSLKDLLGDTEITGAVNDRALVDKAIAAVREILTP